MDFFVDNEDSRVVDEDSVALGCEEVEADVEMACIIWFELLLLSVGDLGKSWVEGGMDVRGTNLHSQVGLLLPIRCL